MFIDLTHPYVEINLRIKVAWHCRQNVENNSDSVKQEYLRVAGAKLKNIVYTAVAIAIMKSL